MVRRNLRHTAVQHEHRSVRHQRSSTHRPTHTDILAKITHTPRRKLVGLSDSYTAVTPVYTPVQHVLHHQMASPARGTLNGRLLLVAAAACHHHQQRTMETWDLLLRYLEVQHKRLYSSHNLEFFFYGLVAWLV